MFRTLFFVLLSAAALGQNQGNIWYFGEGFGLDFNTSPPTLLDNGEITEGTACGDDIVEGTASIADSSGSLLFYTNGETIWNKNHQTMENGTGLFGGISSTQAAIIVPQPLSNSTYYVFTTDDFCNDLQYGLRYSVVDMCGDNGNGEVLTGQKNILLTDTVAEKLTAVRHANNVDYWVLAHGYFSNKFFAYKVTAQGIEPPVVSSTGSEHGDISSGNMWQALGQMKFSPDGSRIAIGAMNGADIFEVFDFDANTGTVSNPISLMLTYGAMGVEFSPDGSIVYRTPSFSQFDLTAGGGHPDSILASVYEYPNPHMSCGNSLQLGPDGKLYMYNCFDNDITVVHEPNVFGAGSNPEQNAYIMQSDALVYGLPAMIAGYDYSATGICSPDGIGETKPSKFSVFPNPTNGQVTIDTENVLETGTLNIFNSAGQRLESIQLKNVRKATTELPSQDGLYLLQLIDENGAQSSVTVVKN